MNKPKGGRGKQAPYESTHVRVPVPIKSKVDKLVEDYRASMLDGEQSEEKPFAMDSITLDEATAIARQILAQKKSAKVSLEKLLTALYDGDVKL